MTVFLHLFFFLMSDHEKLLFRIIFLTFFQQDDIEQIVAQIEEEERKRQETVIKTVAPPSPRSNFSFTAHPSKDELIIFGGEYFNGQKVRMSLTIIF